MLHKRSFLSGTISPTSSQVIKSPLSKSLKLAVGSLKNSKKYETHICPNSHREPTSLLNNYFGKKFEVKLDNTLPKALALKREKEAR